MLRTFNLRAPRAVALTVALCSLSGLAHAANRAPVIWGTPITSALSSNWYDFRPGGSDPDGNPIWFTIANKPSWASFDSRNGRLTGLPPAGTWYNVKIGVTDGYLSASLPAFNIYIKQNTAPIVAGSPPTTVAVGSKYDFIPSATNKDGDRIWYTIVNKPSWAWFNAVNGELAGYPSTAGTYSNIIVGATDGYRSTTLPPFTITVTAPNHAPTISGSPATTVTAGTQYAFQPTAADVDKNTLGFTVQNKPAWANFNTATGALTGTPTSANVGA